MPIYRGAGGAGDATADGSSEALLIRELAIEVQADADAAADSATAAASSASGAATSATNASNSATAAATSATNASNSATAASTSATNAANSATAAQTAETAAELAETNAETAQAAAASSASAASSSASTASTQATNASNSATAAATSATNASNSATAASTSASNASTSATAAAGSASSASTSASNAATSETNAAASASSASTSASTATTQAGIATTQASNASTSATNASNSATSASGSATTATTQATNASNSASAAATSATNASNSASSASTSATNAANSATAAAASAASINPASIVITGGSINGTTVGATTPSTGKFTTLEATGVTTVQAGTVSAPAITTTGDTNTGIFFPAADTIAFTEGGVESMRITSAGDVGIGTSSPSNLVEVSRNQNAETQVRLYNANAGSSARTVLLLGNNSSAGAAGIFLNSSTYSGGGGANALTLYMGLGAPITFETSATERMRIDSSGAVGIGTSSPNAKLDVSGSFDGTTGIGFRLSANSSGANSKIQFTDAVTYNWTAGTTGNAFTVSNGEYPGAVGTERMRIDSSGNVGIGVTPSAWASGYNALQLGASGRSSSIFTNGVNDFWFASNAYFNGTSWIYNQTGTATSYEQNNAHIWNTASSGTAGGTVSFTERMRIDSSGNVNIGSTSVGYGKLGIYYSTPSAALASIFIGSTDGTKSYQLQQTGSAYSYGGVSSNELWYYVNASYSALTFGSDGAVPIKFVSNGSERMRIEGGNQGALLIGTTSNPGGNYKTAIVQNGYDGLYISVGQSPGGHAILANRLSDGDVIQISRSATVVGIISVSGSSTTYATSSDYRLKEDIAPMTGALDKVSTLKPVTYKWKADGSDGQGFIAHELAEVFPDAVNGEKDAVNEDGSIKAQGIDTSFLVATLTAAIQEQQALIETLTNRLNALEGK